jgi:hypothetical protein
MPARGDDLAASAAGVAWPPAVLEATSHGRSWYQRPVREMSTLMRCGLQLSLARDSRASDWLLPAKSDQRMSLMGREKPLQIPYALIRFISGSYIGLAAARTG